MKLNRRELLQAAGLTLGYHNHEIEFVKTPQGDVPWDILVQSTDPSLVRFLIDVGNLAFGGGDPYAYLAKYPTRYYGVHVKDLKPGKAAVPVGAGDLDWTRIFTLVKAAKITNIVAEVGACFDCEAGAGKVAGAVEGLGGAAEVLGEEGFGYRAERDLIFGLREAMALVREDDIRHRHVAPPQDVDHLL